MEYFLSKFRNFFPHFLTFLRFLYVFRLCVHSVDLSSRSLHCKLAKNRQNFKIFEIFENDKVRQNQILTLDLHK